jgi:uncharacterized protein YkwD
MAREAGFGARGLMILGAVVVAIAAAPAQASAMKADCPHAQARPGHVSLGKLRTAIGCLVNNARSKHHLHPVKLNDDLEAIAQDHSKKMVRRDCFKHRCRGEESLKRRIKQSPYVKNATSFRYAEELGYETTPKQMVHRWLGAVSHRSNLLDLHFRNLGVGVRRGAPVKGVPNPKFMTYTLEFAVKKTQ